MGVDLIGRVRATGNRAANLRLTQPIADTNDHQSQPHECRSGFLKYANDCQYRIEMHVRLVSNVIVQPADPAQEFSVRQ
jgi:hypothetical protein